MPWTCLICGSEAGLLGCSNENCEKDSVKVRELTDLIYKNAHSLVGDTGGGLAMSPTKLAVFLIASGLIKKEAKEICIVAAVKSECGKIIRGQRHSDCIRMIIERKMVPAFGSSSQGFITSRNRYVTREEGYILQTAAGIKSFSEGGYRGLKLFSEDLY